MSKIVCGVTVSIGLMLYMLPLVAMEGQGNAGGQGEHQQLFAIDLEAQSTTRKPKILLVAVADVPGHLQPMVDQAVQALHTILVSGGQVVQQQTGAISIQEQDRVLWLQLDSSTDVQEFITGAKLASGGRLPCVVALTGTLSVGQQQQFCDQLIDVLRCSTTEILGTSNAPVALMLFPDNKEHQWVGLCKRRIANAKDLDHVWATVYNDVPTDAALAVELHRNFSLQHLPCNKETALSIYGKHDLYGRIIPFSLVVFFLFTGLGGVLFYDGLHDVNMAKAGTGLVIMLIGAAGAWPLARGVHYGVMKCQYGL